MQRIDNRRNGRAASTNSDCHSIYLPGKMENKKDDGIVLKELILCHTHAKPPILKQVMVTMFSGVGRIEITVKLKNDGIAYGIV
ncbi:hypothetical protein LXL04_020898 [Taraxacum kok-saghyz]